MVRDDSVVFEKHVKIDSDLEEALEWCAARTPAKVEEEREKMMLSIEGLARRLISEGANERWCAA